MNVAFLSYGFGREVSGSGKYGWYLVNELRKLGVCVDIFSTNFIVKTLGAPMLYLKNAFLKLNKYDIVHSNEGSGVFLHHPHMIDTYHHDYKQSFDLNSLTFHNLEMLQCRKVQRIIVPSYATKNSILRYGFKENRISVIYHGVDHTAFRKKNSRDFLRRNYGVSNSFVAITVGKLIKRKRQTDIINALAEIPDTVLILVGKGEEESNIKKLAKEKQVKLIHFKQVPESQLVELYNAADVYVHSSIVEGFGLTVIEAMACALPVICYDIADFKNIVHDAGFLLKPKDVKSMSHAITLLKENPNEKKFLSEVALQKSQAFTWEKTAAEHLKVYKEVLMYN